jgi:hypothetical protein
MNVPFTTPNYVRLPTYTIAIAEKEVFELNNFTGAGVVSDEAIRNRIRKEISLENFKSSGRKEEEWIETEEAQRLLTEDEILKVKTSLELKSIV